MSLFLTMAVEAVVSGVIQKLTDMLKEESISHNTVIVNQLREIGKSLKKMRGYLTDAEDKSETNQAAKNWAGKYLETLYIVEDEIEKFTLRIAHQRKRFGFLMNHALFFNNLNAGRKLRRKMKKVRAQIQKLNKAKPPGLDIASPSTTLSLSSSFGEEQQSLHTRRSINSDTSDADPHEDEEEIDDDEEENNIAEREFWKNAMQYRSPPTISQIHTISPNNANVTLVRSLSAVSPLTQHRKKLTFSYSYNQKETQIVGLKEERLQYPKQMSSFSYQEEELGIFGLRDDVDTLVKRLTKKGERVVSIVGEEGSGKTTLARAIYRSREIKERFDFRAWVSVSKEYAAGDILLSLLKVVDNLKDKGAMIPDQHAMKMRLIECLGPTRYLLVLDGVRTCDVWEELKEAFPDEKNGSKIIFTSSEAGTSPETSVLPHSLTRLCEDDSWRMFLKKAGKEKKQSLIPDNLRQRILEICNGLPLKVVLIAGLLSTKKRSNWPPVLFGQNSNDILALCYNDLTIHTKLCLLYLVLFPKEYDIPVRRLLRLWLAEGFVKRRSKNIIPEDLVQKYFEDLVNRSMIQITKLRSDNSPRRCRLLGVLHDYLLPKAQDISLFYIHRTSGFREDAAGPFGVRRMVEYVDAKEVFAKRGRENKRAERAKGQNVSLFSVLSYFFTSGKLTNSNRGIENSTTPSLSLDLEPTQSKNFAHNPSLLRSYLSFNFQRKDTPAKEVGRLLGRIIDNGFGLLRVLDLEGVYKPSLPEKLGNLYHLRYLGLRWTFLDSLPQSVGDLPYLETLDVKHTFINSLPDSIWKLKHLRHLNLNNIRLAMQPRSSPTLLTLWGLFVDEKISVKNGLNKLLHLRELGMSFNLSSSQGDLLDWIANLTDLQSLRLRSKDGAGHASKLILKPLPNLLRLSHLNLLGNLERLPEHREFPPTLKVLTLSISQLDKDPMRTLGQLPSLTVLRLLANSYLGKEMVCPQKSFPKLRVLKLWVLNDLEDWDVEEGAMKSLKELNIRRCLKLKNIPPRLLQQRTLEELILTGMPVTFTNQVKQRKSKDTSLIVNEWESTPLPREQDNSTSESGNTESIVVGSSVMRPTEVEAKAESVNGLKLP